MIRACLLAAPLLLLPRSADALPRFVEAGAPATVGEAIATRYGQLIVDALEKALAKDADPACLAARSIAPAQLRSHGEALLVRQGQARLDRMMALVDSGKADAEFVQRGGAGAQEEWRALLAEPTVAEYLRIERPVKLVDLVNGTTENFGRYVVLRRIRLGEINPLATGDLEILTLGEEVADAAVEAAEAHRAANDTPAMRRFLEMSEWIAESLQAAIDEPQLLRYGPSQWMQGLDEDLRALCIGTK
jgi:hypothetical protein